MSPENSQTFANEEPRFSVASLQEFRLAPQAVSRMFEAPQSSIRIPSVRSLFQA